MKFFQLLGEEVDVPLGVVGVHDEVGAGSFQPRGMDSRRKQSGEQDEQGVCEMATQAVAI